MPDIGILAERRAQLLVRLHDALGVQALVPGTKDDPFLQQLFEAEALNSLLDRVLDLEDKVGKLEKPRRPKEKAAPEKKK